MSHGHIKFLSHMCDNTSTHIYIYIYPHTHMEICSPASTAGLLKKVNALVAVGSVMCVGFGSLNRAST